MLHYAALDRDLGCGHIPFRGRRGDQHGARGGAGLAQLVPGIRHGGAAAGALDLAEQEIVVAAGRRGFGAHLRPIGVELLGDDGGEPGIGALPHLDMLDHDRHAVVGRDAHEGVGREHAVGRRSGGDARHAGPVEADGQAGGGGGRALEKAAAAGVSERARHDQPSMMRAASWMAARMRTYVAQRQMLPFIALSMSWSLGLALSVSSAVADMIWPD